MSPLEKTQIFLSVAQDFQLGHLLTESFHSKTVQLSHLANNNLSKALDLLANVDAEALQLISEKSSDIWRLACDIESTLKNGNKVFMCGCGATGRLSLVLETLYLQKFGTTDSVISFMAGGDFALIKSVESFEDRPEYGERQLVDLGFGENDLLIASSEGGETPFVIGAAQKASEISQRSPYFIYCNPDKDLLSIKRSRDLINNKKIQKLNLVVGPMAISGSTRMQASTAIMLAIGVGLLYEHKNQNEFEIFFKDFISRLTKTDNQKITSLIETEATLYKNETYLNYVTDPSLGISILTDTTERSPTFSLRGFENKLDHSSQRALSYLFVSGSERPEDAWNKLLGRIPRALDWEELGGRVNQQRVLGFDISEQGLGERSSHVKCEVFSIFHQNENVTFRCLDKEVTYHWGTDPLFVHLNLKMLLNAHSTLIMGILERYEGNIMTWVRPSNNKLIDRSARYILEILRRRGKILSYEEVVLKLFEEIENVTDNEAVVIRVVEKF